MRRILFFISVILTASVNAQIGAIGPLGKLKSISYRSLTDSTAGGIPVHRVNTAQMNAISSPVAGTFIYNNDSAAFCYYNGSVWAKVSSGTSSGGGGVTVPLTLTSTTTPQLNIAYDGSNTTGLSTNSTGQFVLAPSAGTTLYNAFLGGTFSRTLTGTGNSTNNRFQSFTNNHSGSNQSYQGSLISSINDGTNTGTTTFQPHRFELGVNVNNYQVTSEGITSIYGGNVNSGNTNTIVGWGFNAIFNGSASGSTINAYVGYNSAQLATSGTLTNGYGFWARGASSSVSNYRGFRVENSSATGNNYGIELLMNSGANKFNIMASGTANNYMNGNLGLLTNAPTAPVDINGTTLRVRTSFTPTGTADTAGNVGDVTFDDNYIYRKTSTGWKRSALSTF